MVQADPNRATLPSSAELPCSDDIPVDNENQNFIPNVLRFLLEFIWRDRMDWFYAVNMGVYHITGVNPRVPIVPDAFLCLGVERRKQSLQGRGRSSYVTWEENYIPPILTLEVVSQTYGGEYDDKMRIYAGLGVLYYVIYNPEFWRRDQHQPFEVYKLVNGSYQLQIGEPLWMPEIELGLGRFRCETAPVNQEALSWFDVANTRYLLAEERFTQAQQRAEQERQTRLNAASSLLSMGLSVEQVAETLSLLIDEVQSRSQS